MESRSAAIRRRLNHPVIDSDGHFVEYLPMFLDYLKAEAGAGAIEGFHRAWNQTPVVSHAWYEMSPQERSDRRVIRPGFWSVPTKNTRDLAASILPRLLYERLDEIGLDVTVLYPGIGFMALGFDDDEIRRASCRALNRMYRDLFSGFEDRMIPVGVIPMHTPQEAIAELEFAVRELGMRAVVMATYVVRPVAEAARRDPEMARFATWADTFGIDSLYDYDPVWAKCLELKVAATFHSVAQGWGFRRSVSNHMYNSLGHFAAASEAGCKSLLLGGVTRRFPQLRFAFLECGVGWARSLLSDAIRFWQKRNRAGMENYNPANLDRDEFNRLLNRYGEKVVSGRAAPPQAQFVSLVAGTDEDAGAIDEWARSGIRTEAEFAEVFTRNFYFGCEADDPVTSSAFDASRNPLHVKFNAVLGSDIGHWDVPDMSKVLEETYEPVEKGLFTEEDLRDFVFTNPVKLWTAQNPAFFKGTVVQDQVAGALHG